MVTAPKFGPVQLRGRHDGWTVEFGVSRSAACRVAASRVRARGTANFGKFRGDEKIAILCPTCPLAERASPVRSALPGRRSAVELAAAVSGP
jgi:hypothetical protein